MCTKGDVPGSPDTVDMVLSRPHKKDAPGLPEAAKLRALGAAPGDWKNSRDSGGDLWQYQATPYPHLAQADSPAPTAARQCVSDSHGYTL